MNFIRRVIFIFLGLAAACAHGAPSSDIEKLKQIIQGQIKFYRVDDVSLRPVSACPSWVSHDVEQRQCRRFDVLYRGVYLSGVLIHNESDADELTIYHVGHEANRNIIDSTSQMSGELIGEDAVWLVNKFLGSRSDVLILFMPGSGFSPESTRYSGDVGRLHKMLSVHAVFSMLDFDKDSAASYFLVHAKSFLDKFASKYARISMVGRSGGGWATTFAAAVDRRIQCSVSIFGTLPMKVRLPVDGDERNDLGDFEQHGFLIYKNIDYTDLYALAAHPNRRHSLILNEKDDCCFSGGVKGPLMWQAFVESYPHVAGFKWFNVPKRSESDHYNIDDSVLSSIKMACPNHWKSR